MRREFRVPAAQLGRVGGGRHRGDDGRRRCVGGSLQAAYRVLQQDQGWLACGLAKFGRTSPRRCDVFMYLSVCQDVWVSVCLQVCVSVCICLYVCMCVSVCLSVVSARVLCMCGVCCVCVVCVCVVCVCVCVCPNSPAHVCVVCVCVCEFTYSRPRRRGAAAQRVAAACLGGQAKTALPAR